MVQVAAEQMNGISMNNMLSRRDLDFLLYEWLDVESLTSRQRFDAHSRETFDAVLDLSADIALKHFAPHNKLSDVTEPTMRPDGTVEMIHDVKDALDIYSAAGLLAGEFDNDLGGMQLPTTIARAAMAWFQAANASTSSYPLLTIASANLLAEYGTPPQIDDYVRPMLEGRYFGTMCLSEPQAGSSLADLTTRAVKQDDTSYRITGTKMWISGGDHELSENIIHLVLARTAGREHGVKGISLFVVPKLLSNRTRNDVTLVGLNHKMGNRGTTNTLLNFGDGTHSPSGQPGAIGFLVGEEHRGLHYMFHMMNEARIGIGFLATSLGYVGYMKSLEYAKTRTQGRPPTSKNPSTPPVALIEHPDVRRMLLAQKSYVEGAFALGLYCSMLVDEQDTADDERMKNESTLLLDVLTPITKSWPSQWCLEANSLAIQIHGGYGYARDFDVEQHYRDNRLNLIHEGTQGIQGLDLLGRKVTNSGGQGLLLLGGRLGDTVHRAQGCCAETVGFANDLDTSWKVIVEVTAVLWASGDPSVALANSTIYLEAMGHIVIAWMWLEQLIVAEGKCGDFYDGKRQAGRYFFLYELPRVAPQLHLLSSLDRTTLDMKPEWF